MPHICGDEIMAFMMAVPVLGIAVVYARDWAKSMWARLKHLWSKR